VLSDAQDCVLPRLAVYVMDVSAARDILDLARLVNEYDLHRLEKLDRRAVYYREGGEVLSVDDEEPTVHERLLVTADNFCFVACLQDTRIEVRTENVSMAELVESFGLETVNNDLHEPHAVGSPSP
jgi:hypothetical protein